MASDFVDTRDHWNSGVRELTKWVELQSTREVTEYTGRPRQIKNLNASGQGTKVGKKST